MNERDPTKGSVMILNASAENGSSSLLLRTISLSVPIFTPRIAWVSSGAGR